MRKLLHLSHGLYDLHAAGVSALGQHDHESALSSSRTVTSTVADWVAQQPPLAPVDAVPVSILMVAHRPSPDHSTVLHVLGELNPRRYQIILIENSADPVFPDDPALSRPNFHLMNLNLNYGMGIARQLALLMATGRIVVFLDDDGITTADSIEALVSTIENYGCTAVRGRIRPKTPGSVIPPHYDVGNRLLRRFCDTEGMSAWNKQHMLDFNGFDPLLHGHEGVDLTCRMYPEFGPDAFLYQPNALMLHDFSATLVSAKEKKARYDAYDGYLTQKNADFSRIKGAFYKQSHTPASVSTLQFKRDLIASCLAAPNIGKSAPSLTFVTTCFNGAGFVSQWIRSLQRQTDTDFKVVFVDDGSTDGSADLVARQWQSSIPIQIERIKHSGRPAALNHAVAQVTTDACLIADIDDRSLSQRVEWTRQFLHQRPDADMLGFMIFDNDSFARMSRPVPTDITPLSSRAVFGSPAPFPGFCWRKDRIKIELDVNLAAGSDCDWMYRSLFEAGAKGYMVPLRICHYGVHEGQISHSKRGVQQSVLLRHLGALHDRILPGRPDKAERIAQFSGWTKIETPADFLLFRDYCLELYEGVGTFHALCPQCVRALISTHLAERSAELARLDSPDRAAKPVSPAPGNNAEAELQRMLSSRSWRMTKPLRQLASLLRR